MLNRMLPDAFQSSLMPSLPETSANPSTIIDNASPVRCCGAESFQEYTTANTCTNHAPIHRHVYMHTYTCTNTHTHTHASAHQMRVVVRMFPGHRRCGWITLESTPSPRQNVRLRPHLAPSKFRSPVLLW